MNIYPECLLLKGINVSFCHHNLKKKTNFPRVFYFVLCGDCRDHFRPDFVLILTVLNSFIFEYALLLSSTF